MGDKTASQRIRNVLASLRIVSSEKLQASYNFTMLFRDGTMPERRRGVSLDRRDRQAAAGNLQEDQSITRIPVPIAMPGADIPTHSEVTNSHRPHELQICAIAVATADNRADRILRSGNSQRFQAARSELQQRQTLDRYMNDIAWPD